MNIQSDPVLSNFHAKHAALKTIEKRLLAREPRKARSPNDLQLRAMARSRDPRVRAREKSWRQLWRDDANDRVLHDSILFGKNPGAVDLSPDKTQECVTRLEAQKAFAEQRWEEIRAEWSKRAVEVCARPPVRVRARAGRWRRRTRRVVHVSANSPDGDDGSGDPPQPDKTFASAGGSQ